MIKAQCNNCSKFGTSECTNNIIYNSSSCEHYASKIDLNKHEKSIKIDLVKHITASETENMKGNTDSTLMHQTSESVETTITAEQLKQNTKIHGWLSVFLVSIGLGGILSVIYIFTTLNIDEYGGSLFLCLADISFGLLVLLLAILVIYSFVKRKANSVFLAKTYLITIFVSRLLFLFYDDFDKISLENIVKIVRSLIVNFIWFLYLLNSSQLDKVIPKKYRKRTVLNYYILAALIFVPSFFLAIGVADVKHKQQKQESQFIVQTSLKPGEYTDGKIIFTCPSSFSCSKKYIENQNIIFFELSRENVADITIVSDYDSDISKSNFDSYWKSWYDEELKEFEATIISNTYRYINDNKCFRKIVKYSNETIEIYWRFAMLFDRESGKVCLVSEYDFGVDNYFSNILQSIRFK